MSKYQGIIDRLSNATEADHMINRAICNVDPGPCPEIIPYGYTASIDASIALVERMLPGWACGFDRGPKTIIAFVDRHDFSERMFGAKYAEEAKTAPIAILLALFKALQSQEGAK